MKLSANFTTEELKCKCGRCRVGQAREDYDESLLFHLQALRDLYGKAIRINSGARCPEWNANPKVGGKPNSAHLPLDDSFHSQHNKVRAVDVEVQGGQNRWDIVFLAREAGFRRIGVAKTFVHMDTAFGGPYVQDVIWVY